MTREEAFALVVNSIEKATKNRPEGLTEDTDLVADDVIDSLDSMTILFEMEDAVGGSLGVSDDYEDYKISALVDLVLNAKT